MRKMHSLACLRRCFSTAREAAVHPYASQALGLPSLEARSAATLLRSVAPLLQRSVKWDAESHREIDSVTSELYMLGASDAAVGLLPDLKRAGFPMRGSLLAKHLEWLLACGEPSAQRLLPQQQMEEGAGDTLMAEQEFPDGATDLTDLVNWLAHYREAAVVASMGTSGSGFCFGAPRPLPSASEILVALTQLQSKPATTAQVGLVHALQNFSLVVQERGEFGLAQEARQQPQQQALLLQKVPAPPHSGDSDLLQRYLPLVASYHLASAKASAADNLTLLRELRDCAHNTLTKASRVLSPIRVAQAFCGLYQSGLLANVSGELVSSNSLTPSTICIDQRHAKSCSVGIFLTLLASEMALKAALGVALPPLLEGNARLRNLVILTRGEIRADAANSALRHVLAVSSLRDERIGYSHTPGRLFVSSFLLANFCKEEMKRLQGLEALARERAVEARKVATAREKELRAKTPREEGEHAHLNHPYEAARLSEAHAAEPSRAAAAPPRQAEPKHQKRRGEALAQRRSSGGDSEGLENPVGRWLAENYERCEEGNVEYDKLQTVRACVDGKDMEWSVPEGLLPAEYLWCTFRAQAEGADRSMTKFGFWQHMQGLATKIRVAYTPDGTFYPNKGNPKHPKDLGHQCYAVKIK